MNNFLIKTIICQKDSLFDDKLFFCSFHNLTTTPTTNITTKPTIQVLVSMNPGVTTLISCAVIALLVVFYITYVSTIGNESIEDESRSSNISSLQNERILQYSKPLSAFSPYYKTKMRHHQIDEYVTFAKHPDNMILSLSCEDHRCYGDNNQRIEDI